MKTKPAKQPATTVEWRSRTCRSAANSILVLSLSFICVSAAAQEQKTLSTKQLKMLSVEDLMNLEVTLVSRSPQKFADAASAVQLITGEDIRNSGATNIAEALRLVTNLQVAQLRSNAWLVSSRGFNTVFANKLLVMIDGRTVYTPLFAGVFWDIQNVLLEDVDRIEVVSGPGGTLWGANAVNGIINIVTKSSSTTPGLYATASVGSFVKNQEAVRWGGKIGDKITYRVYGQHSIEVPASCRMERISPTPGDLPRAVSGWTGPVVHPTRILCRATTTEER